MRRLKIIGIGMGDPAQLTGQAIAAIAAVDVFFVVDKRAETADLVRYRTELCDRYATPPFRVVPIADPPRDRAPADYGETVRDWHGARAALWERTVLAELPDGGTAGLLVWGDPSLYDSTIRIVERLRDRGAVQFEYDVVPGISAIQALTAAHRTTLNTIGGSVRITTGRQLAGGWPTDDSIVVLLDAHLVAADASVPGYDANAEIYWGAYLGTTHEVLVTGRIGDVGDQIAQLRAACRENRGWIMDTYLLRRPAASAAATSSAARSPERTAPSM